MRQLPVIVCNDFLWLCPAARKQEGSQHSCAVFAHSAEKEEWVTCLSSFSDDLHQSAVREIMSK